MSERLPHDLNCLTISELQKHAAVMMDKQTRDYYNEVSNVNIPEKDTAKS